MGLAKLEKFTAEDNRTARYAKALGHPARVSILKFLIGKRSCVCGDIVDELPLSQSTVSQHLKELKEAGLIQGTIEGPRTCYCIDPEAWASARQHLVELLDSFTPTPNDTCC